MSINISHWLSRHQKPLVLVTLTIVAYWAALNRSQTLPWAISALLLATLITGFTWPHWLIRHISITRKGPERAQEGESIQLHIEIHNEGVMPRFMIEAVDHLPFIGAADQDTSSFAPKTLGLVAYIGGGTSRKFEVSLLCEKRGYYKLGPAGVASSFPLGLAEAQQSKNGGIQSLTIYPSIFPIISLPLSGTPSEIHRGGLLLPKGVGSAEFSGLREYRRGDNPRHVHWPTTARLNELMVKEFEPLASASLYLALDLASNSNAGRGKHSCFEYAIRIAASIGRYACDNHMPIRLYGEGEQTLAIGLGSGEGHFQEMLDALAIINADGHSSYAKTLQNVAINCRYGQTVVVFLSVPKPEIAETIQAISLILARGAYVMAITFDRDSFLDGNNTPQSDWAGLFDLGISYYSVKKGDDLMRLFNP